MKPGEEEEEKSAAPTVASHSTTALVSSNNIRTLTLHRYVKFPSARRMDIVPFILLAVFDIIATATWSNRFIYLLPVIAGMQILMLFICIWSVHIRSLLQFTPISVILSFFFKILIF
jgi:hypothetical protein